MGLEQGQSVAEHKYNPEQLKNVAYDLYAHFNEKVLGASVVKRALKEGSGVFWQEGSATVILLSDKEETQGWLIEWSDSESTGLRSMSKFPLPFRENQKGNIGEGAALQLGRKDLRTIIVYSKNDENETIEYEDSEEVNSNFERLMQELRNFNPENIRVHPFVPS